LQKSLRNTLQKSLRNTLQKSLRNTLQKSLRNTLQKSLCNTLAYNAPPSYYGGSFAEYRLFYRALLQKIPRIVKSLLVVATPYSKVHSMRAEVHSMRALYAKVRALYVYIPCRIMLLYIQSCIYSCIQGRNSEVAPRYTQG